MRPDLSERNRRILVLWSEGFSASQIADETGTTRNAVIGVANRSREGMTYGAAPAERRRMELRKPRKRVLKPSAPKIAPKVAEPGFSKLLLPKPAPAPASPPKPALPPGRFGILDLGVRQCRFATTSHRAPPAGHRFCGRTTRFGESYCPAHRKLSVDPKRTIRLRF
jgi:hypothetical protein